MPYAADYACRFFTFDYADAFAFFSTPLPYADIYAAVEGASLPRIRNTENEYICAQGTRRAHARQLINVQ